MDLGIHNCKFFWFDNILSFIKTGIDKTGIDKTGIDQTEKVSFILEVSIDYLINGSITVIFVFYHLVPPKI